MPLSLITLPSDLLRTIMGQLAPRDLRSLGGANRRLRDMAQADDVWVQHAQQTRHPLLGTARQTCQYWRAPLDNKVAWSRPLQKTLAGNIALSEDRMLSWCDFEATVWCGTSKVRLAGHTRYIVHAALDERRAIACTLYGGVRVWDLADGRCMACLWQPENRPALEVAIREDIAATAAIDCAFIWRATTGTLLHAIAAPDVPRLFLAERTLFTESYRFVAAWDVTTGQCKHRFHEATQSLAVDGDILVTCSHKQIFVWDAQTLALRTCWRRNSGFTSVALSANALATVSPERVCTIWDIASGHLCHEFKIPYVGIGRIVMSGPTLVVLTGGPARCQAWHFGPGPGLLQRLTLPAHKARGLQKLWPRRFRSHREQEVAAVNEGFQLTDA